MPARVDWVADPFAAASCADIRQPLACRRAHLLELVQNVGARLLQKWSPLFAQLDRVGEFDAARDVRHLTNYFQRRALTQPSLEIEAKGLAQLQLRYSQIVLGGNQLRDLVVQLYIRLQHIEPWNGSGLEPGLLVSQLSFQKMHVLLVHADELTVNNDLVKLSFHRRDK